MPSCVGQSQPSLLFSRNSNRFRLRSPLSVLWLCSLFLLTGCDGANFLTELVEGEDLCEKAVSKVQACCSPDQEYSLNPAFSMVCAQYVEENAEALVSACKKSGFQIEESSAILIKSANDCNNILLQVEHDLRQNVDGDEEIEYEFDEIDFEEIPGEETEEDQIDEVEEGDFDEDNDTDQTTDQDEEEIDTEDLDQDSDESDETDIEEEADEEEIVTNCTEEGQICNDGNSCTLNDRCDENLVCTGTPDEFMECNDGNPCTLNDRCNVVGECVGSRKTCNDLGPTPVCHLPAACDTTDGECKFPLATNGQTCNDGKFCTTQDSCEDGVCLGHGPPPCDEPGNEECIVYGCDEENDLCQWNAEDGTECSDSGNLCYSGAICESGQCVPDEETAVVPCPDDGNPCTRDECSSTEGCIHPAIAGKVCDDSLYCTINDRCNSNGDCVAEPYDCSVPFGGSASMPHVGMPRTG